MENSRICEICNVNVHRASYAKHLRSRKHLENEIILPGRICKEDEQEEQTSIQKQTKKVNNLKTLKQIARENIKIIAG